MSSQAYTVQASTIEYEATCVKCTEDKAVFELDYYNTDICIGSIQLCLTCTEYEMNCVDI